MADFGSCQLPVAANAIGSGTVTFGVRPENVVLAPGAPGEARIFDIEDQGVVKILVMDMGETRLHVTVPAGTHVQRDEQVRFGWKPDRVVTFDIETGANLALL
ncbi:TOBE domain-containing protein [Tabrizicola piscis]|uniref:TOBE domain-containing protein n=1 Tax=Tabrizicola piscis TaxID=2494374 RepID=UPI001C201638|nr:TOBE domain-containing protein [Tabrizicola piscis]